MASLYGMLLDGIDPELTGEFQDDLLQTLMIAMAVDVIPILEKAKTSLTEKYRLAELLSS